MNLKNIVEALLFASSEPLTLKQIQTVFADDPGLCPEKSEIQGALTALTADYQGRPVQLIEVASGFRFQVKQELSPWISRLLAARPPRYSKALLETLSIIAYQQPVTRGEIEAIRGVSVSTPIIRTLIEREWIKVVGHRELPGKPALYATTRHFLDYFNLTTLEQLPALNPLQTHLSESLTQHDDSNHDQ